MGLPRVEKARAHDHPRAAVLEDETALRVKIIVDLAKDTAILRSALKNRMPEPLPIPGVCREKDQFSDGIEIRRLHQAHLEHAPVYLIRTSVSTQIAIGFTRLNMTYPHITIPPSTVNTCPVM